jgi:hypothetical protein
MTDHIARLYALAAAVVVLFLAWAVVAAHPWQTQTSPATADPRVKALVSREHRIRHESLVVRRVVARRWRHYRIELRQRRHQITATRKRHQNALAAAAAAPASTSPSYSTPSVQVVTLPPLTVTRTS